MNRLCIVNCEPYPDSASRQRNPFLMTKMMLRMIRRSSTCGMLGHNEEIRLDPVHLCLAQQSKLRHLQCLLSIVIKATDH